MPRAKSKSAIKHRKIKSQARGFSHARRKRVKAAHESLLHAGQYAYIGRKLKKRNLKRLWIIRLNAAARQHGLKYSQLVKKLNDSKIEVNKKILADIAVKDPKSFEKIIKGL